MVFLTDARGLEVTTQKPEAIAAINTLVEQLLNYGNAATEILKGVEADPTNVMVNTQTAVMYLLLENPQGFQLAKPYLETAAANLEQASEHEKLYFNAVKSWYDGDVDKAVQLHEQIAEQYPRDLASIKLCQYHHIYLGNSQAILNIAQKVVEANTDSPYIYGMLAFGLEECHRFPEAEQAARQALAMSRYEPWAQHALAHVFEMQGRIDEGIELLESYSDTWADCNSFMYTHNWWHLALYYLDRDQHAKVLDIYDNHMWGRWKEYSQDQVGAISMLWRLELRGVDVGNRWQELASYAANRTHEHCQPFLDLHYLYALARVGMQDKVSEMLDNMSNHAANAKPFIRPTLLEVAVPAAKGIIAYAQRDYPTALKEIAPIHHRIQELGGSHAQRDLFTQTYLDTLIQTDNLSQACELLEKRVEKRNNVPSLHRTLATLYSQLGEASKSEVAQQKAVQLAGV